MYLILRQRSQQALLDLHELLLAMGLDPRIASTLAASDARTVRSSASTPSLRSRDGSVPMLARMDGGGNVRVVVRVRAFLKRGQSRKPCQTSPVTIVDNPSQSLRSEQNV